MHFDLIPVGNAVAVLIERLIGPVGVSPVKHFKVVGEAVEVGVEIDRIGEKNRLY